MTLAGIIGLLLSVVLGAPGNPRSTYTPPDALWQQFVAIKVGDGGRKTPFARTSNIEVGLVERTGKLAPGRWIWWEAGCNSAGGRVKVKPHRLYVGLLSSTVVGCPPQEQREDRWLWNFFEADPHWRLHGGRLMLRAGERVIRLRPKRRSFGSS